MYIVYKHTAPNGKAYIGATCQKPNSRWRNGKGYLHNTLFSSEIEKYGWDSFKHEILFSGLTREEAEAKEREMIAFYKTNDRSYGYNFESGGTKKKNLAKQTREKISRSHIGMKYGEAFGKRMSELKTGNKYSLGHKVSKESRAIISEKNKGRFAGDKNYFHTHLFLGGNHPKARAVEQYDKQGNFICRRECAEDFAKELNIINASHIIDVCKGKRKMAYGFIWKYARKES